MAVRETIFDQSMSTLERIDIILRNLHQICAENLSSEMIEDYHKAVVRLCKEAFVKFSKSEERKSDDYVYTLNRLRNKWGNALYKSKLANHSQALKEMHMVLDKYEDFLLKSLDTHGMMMKDRASETDAFKV